MFRVNDSGFSLNLDNGWTISVQFSPFNYCSNRKDLNEYHEQLSNKLMDNKWDECENAEIAVFQTTNGIENEVKGDWHNFGTEEYPEEVIGYQTMENFIEVLNMAKDLPKVVHEGVIDNQ